ncbi:MAG: UDP-N-acetylmuramate dehydrogenase [Candidatus Paceibacterota bacterium]
MTLAIKENVSLKDYTTLKTGGVGLYLVEVGSVEELGQAVDLAKQHQLPVLVIGEGSNFLISDEGFSGLVIKVNILGRDYVEDGETVTFTCGAGETLDKIVAETVTKGYWGLENLSAIPGTVGATPVQNVGAYGVEIKDVVKTVETFHLLTKEKKVFTNHECRFGYRDSFFKTDEGRNYVITKVSFVLSKNAKPKIDYADLQKFFSGSEISLEKIRQAIISIRANKFPDWKVVGTAGSFFKNPIVDKVVVDSILLRYPDLPVYQVDENSFKIPLGFVLDKICNLKGYRVGQVGLYENQALVLVNYGENNATEIKNFVTEITKIVAEKTGIKIEPEVRFVF